MSYNPLGSSLHQFLLKAPGKRRAVLACIAISTISIITNYPPIIFVMHVSAQENSNVSNVPFKPYNNTQYKFAIEYPENWNIKERDSAIWFASPVDGSSGNFGVQVQSSQNISMGQLVQDQLERYKQGFKDFHVISSNLTSLFGKTANRTDYSFKSEEPKYLGTDLFGTTIDNFLALAVSTIKNGNFYTVTYISTAENFDKFLPTAEKMLSTLKLL
jgi:eukaryotic-like serine/threonine-protein kinase